MGRIKFRIIALISFLLVIGGSFFKRVVAVTLCGVLSVNSPACYFLGQNRAIAASPAASESSTIIAQTDIFRNDGGGNNNQGDTDTFRNDGGNNTPPDSGTDIFINPDNQNKPDNNSPFNNQKPAPDDTKISSTTIEGCKIELTFQDNNGIKSIESVNYFASNEELCGQSFITTVTNSGNRVKTVESQGQTSILERLSNKDFRLTNINEYGEKILADLEINDSREVAVKYIDDSNKTVIKTFDIPQEVNIPNSFWESNEISSSLSKQKQNSSKFSNKSGSFDACEEFEDLCNSISKASDMVGIVESVSIITGIGAIPIIGQTIQGTLAAVDTGLSFAQIPCFVAYGGDPPIPFAKALKYAGKGLSSAGRLARSGRTRLAGRQLGKFGERIKQTQDQITEIYDQAVYGGNEKVKELHKLTKKLFGGEDKPNEPTWTDKIRDAMGLSAPCKDRDKTNSTEQPSEKRSGDLTKGTSYGDPHLITFDGFRYSFQTVGEFVLAKSLGGDFEVQTRQAAVPGRQLSLNTAAAMKVGSDRVAFYSKFFPDSNTSTPVRVNGTPTVIQNSLSLSGGGTIYRQGGNNYLVQWPTGEQVAIRMIRVASAEYMNVTPYVLNSPGGQFVGLLGNLDSNPSNDLRTRSGNAIPSKSTYGEIKQLVTNIVPIPGVVPLGRIENKVFEQIYKDFGNSWRVSQEESLFDYAQGQTTATFTDKSFPSQYRTLNSLSPQQIQQAEATCLEAGVEPDLLEGCIFDVGFTGETSFAQAAANAFDIINQFDDLIPGGLPIPKPPISVPGLPF